MVSILHHCLIFGVHFLLLSKYSGQQEILLSYPINLRSRGEQRVVGCFINNLPLKIDLKNNNTLKEIIEDITRHQKKIKPYKNYSFTNIVQDIRKKNNNNPIEFNIGFAESNLNLMGMDLTGLDIQSLDITNNQCVYDLLCAYEHNKNKIKFRVKYKKNSIESRTIEQFANQFKVNAVSLIANNFDINHTSIVTQKELRKILYDWNATDQDYPHNKTIHQLFEEQVVKTPNAIAVIYEDQRLSYQELNEQSNQLARYLREYYLDNGVEFKPGSLFVLYLERSIEMIIGILGVLKAGGAYVPIEPNYPKDRIQYILEETQCHILLTHTHLIQSVSCFAELNPDISVIALDNKPYQAESGLDLIPCSSSTDLCYVIYTSGTTGSPKGVMVEHKAVTNTLVELYGIYQLNLKSKVIEYTSYVFDVSVSEIFTTLLQGAELHILANNVRKDVQLLSSYLIGHEITHVYLPPAILSVPERARGNETNFGMS